MEAPESSPEGRPTERAAITPLQGLRPEKKHSLNPSTQAVGLGFARLPLRGYEFRAETSLEFETPGQPRFGTPPGAADQTSSGKRCWPDEGQAPPTQGIASIAQRAKGARVAYTPNFSGAQMEITVLEPLFYETLLYLQETL